MYGRVTETLSIDIETSRSGGEEEDESLAIIVKSSGYYTFILGDFSFYLRCVLSSSSSSSLSSSSLSFQH